MNKDNLLSLLVLAFFQSLTKNVQLIIQYLAVAPAPKQEVAGAKAKGASVKVRPDEEEDERPVTYRPAERKGGDILNVMLAFVPQDLKAIS